MEKIIGDILLYYEKKNVPYDEYVIKQGRKANNPEKAKLLVGSVPKRIKKFEEIFKEARKSLNKGNILCLGARTGCEIKAAENLGYAATGIDLYPLDLIVIKGDWHNIPFPDDMFDNVYTNAVDHCYDVEKLALEVKRVLVPNGLFFFQLSNKQMLQTKEDKEKYMMESGNFLFWETGQSLADAFAEYGFQVTKTWSNHKNENFIMRVDK